ncbi:cytosine permease [Pelomonas sp. KK5]|uniref:cytosine permease n=1 Tax=Pelomonas sp. KK5 TaxID=1855730 RepID=UPI00097CB822|nr:cytosine permease [Pelomonas sp. KK5]
MSKADSENSLDWLGLATIWFGGMVSVPSLFIGSTLIAGLSFTEVLLAGLVGFSVVAGFMSLESVAAVDQRRNTVELASSAFGRSGANLVLGLALGLSLLGWFGVQAAVAGASFARILKMSFAQVVPASGASLLMGLLMMLTAVFGFRHVKWLNFIGVPCKMALLAYAMVVAFQSHSWAVITQYRPAPEHRIDMLTAIGLCIGFFSVGGVVSPDYARHARTRRDAILGSVLGLLPSAMGMAACGAILAVIQQTYDIVEIYARMGMPVLALSILILAAWTTNVMNAYSSGLALNGLLHWPATRRRTATLIAGVMGSLLAASGILDHFTNFLMLLTATVPPVAGVIVCDYWLARSYRADEAQRRPWQAQGIAAWVCGVAATLLLSHPIRSIVGIVVAAAVFYLLTALQQPRGSGREWRSPSS